MTNPVLVQARRGGQVESSHRGAVAIYDADGKAHWQTGQVEWPVFPRSAVKVIQALPLIESGAADDFGFGNRELALACASHSGEPEHAELARSMLERAGLEEDALECGAHWPTRQQAALDLARAGGQPTALHNNCSGKHSGFLCTCRHDRIDHRGYVEITHPMQDMVRDVMDNVTRAIHASANCGTDGCSIPTYAVPLKNLATGFARLATGEGIHRERAKAAKRLFAACMAEPFFVAGTGRADTTLMSLAPGRIFVKTGAEGVYCGAVPELGLGIALKCDDGAGRAAEVMIAAVLAKLFDEDEALVHALSEFANPVLKNWNGIEVGRLAPTEAITQNNWR